MGPCRITAAPNSVVENLYGPTELTIACFVQRWTRGLPSEACVNEVVPIGTPFPGLGAMIIDDAGEPARSGEEGELWVSGPQTVPGYWQNEDAAQEKSVEHDITPTRSQRFYKTGDRVIRSESGTYHYLGRIDHQIKIRGWPVEVG